MVYLAALALIITLVAFYKRSRSRGFWSTSLDTFVAAAVGWIAGLMIGVGARVGMWSIPFFNGVDSRFTWDGTLQVVLVFSLYGIGLAIVYELFFRQLLKRRGLIFGSLVTILLSYPLAAAALQQLSFTPSLVPLAAVTLLLVGLMFLPYSILLEFLLFRWHEFRNEGTGTLTDLRVR